MVLAGLAHAALVLAWVACSAIFADGAPRWMFPAMLAMQQLLGAALLVRWWSVVAPARRTWMLVIWLFGLLPPLAPPAFCHLNCEVTRRAARVAPDEPLAHALMRLSRSWFLASNFGVVLLVFWGWRAFESFLEPVRGVSFHPWLDPLAGFGPTPSTFSLFVLALIASWFALLLLRTGAVLRGTHRALRGTSKSR